MKVQIYGFNHSRQLFLFLYDQIMVQFYVIFSFRLLKIVLGTMQNEKIENFAEVRKLSLRI